MRLTEEVGKEAKQERNKRQKKATKNKSKKKQISTKQPPHTHIMRRYVASVLCRLGRYCLTLRHRRRMSMGGNNASIPQPKMLQISGTPPGTVYVATGSDGRTVVVTKERLAGAPVRTWHAVRRSAGLVVMERTRLSDRLVPSDFGLSSAVIADAKGVKHFFGANDVLDDWLRC